MLEALNVWTIVKGDEAKPIGATLANWEKRETTAKVLLRLSVKDNIIPHIRAGKTSKETWDILKGLYEALGILGWSIPSTNRSNHIQLVHSKSKTIHNPC